MSRYVLALDQGTSSTRAALVDRAGSIVASAQLEHAQLLPQPGWVEHDPKEIWHASQRVIALALENARASVGDVVAVGIANQRETTVVWDRHSGEPVCNAIVWQDTRTQPIVDRLAADGGVERFADRTGLPLATYFSATKLAWILDHVPGARESAERGDLLFGTVDCWLLWNLTGGVDGGVHATDVTNASRTLLMDLRTLDWDREILIELGLPEVMLPEVRSSSEVLGHIAADSPLAGVPIAGLLGDQQAATFGQAAFGPGESKNTYGTGNFLIVNTGDRVVRSEHGLLTTVAYRLGGEPTQYALEGSVAVSGSLLHWLRDGLGMVESAAEAAALARTVEDSGGVVIVPAFSGLYAPYWRPDARGLIAGLTRFATRAHLARAALEATAFQTADVIDAAVADTGTPIAELRVDGGMTVNDELMQFQADLLGIPVVRPAVIETTALGAAFAAGLAVGFWSDLDELRARRRDAARWTPDLARESRDRLRRTWRKAVERSFGWLDDDS